MILHTRYKGFRSCGFRQEDFFSFSYISRFKYVTPQVGRFWTQGHNSKKLGRGPLDDATDHISRLWALWFQKRFLSQKSILSLFDLDM